MTNDVPDSGKAALPPADLPKNRVPGIDKGNTWIADDFDAMSADELNDWYGR